jgi:hypothetical protein
VNSFGKVSKQGWLKVLVGFMAGTILSGTAAYSLTVNNTPEGGYLLCYNTKTSAVTFPGKLKCPRGTKALEVAGVNGAYSTNPSTVEPSTSPTPAKTSLKCTLAYLMKPGVNIAEGVASCNGNEIDKLLKDVQLEGDASSSTVSIEKQKLLIEITTAIVVEIQKKVKG